MTQREFFNAVKAIENIDPALVEYADKALTALDNKNAKRSANGSSKTAKAMEEWRTKVNAFLPTAPDTGLTAKQIAKALTTDEEEVSTQKVTAIMKTYENDTVETYEDKDEKKNKVKFYRFTA